MAQALALAAAAQAVVAQATRTKRACSSLLRTAPRVALSVVSDRLVAVAALVAPRPHLALRSIVALVVAAQATVPAASAASRR